MKHNMKVIIILTFLFVLAQVIGLGLLCKNISLVHEPISGDVVDVDYTDSILGPAPKTDNHQFSFWYLISAFAIGTVLILLLIKFRKINWWKVIFFINIWIVLSVTFSVLLGTNLWALIISSIIVFWRLLKPNTFIRTIAELFLYPGLALILVPMLNVSWTIVILLVISVYDIIAVWKSKHMVKMAEFMMDGGNNYFAGILIPYKRKDGTEETNAILGGGDIAFPLIFVGVVLKKLLILNALPKITAFFVCLIIVATTATALFLLFRFGKEDKYYPAMPYLTAGCLAGFVIVSLLTQIL